MAWTSEGSGPVREAALQPARRVAPARLAMTRKERRERVVVFMEFTISGLVMDRPDWSEPAGLLA